MRLGNRWDITDGEGWVAVGLDLIGRGHHDAIAMRVLKVRVDPTRVRQIRRVQLPHTFNDGGHHTINGVSIHSNRIKGVVGPQSLELGEGLE